MSAHVATAAADAEGSAPCEAVRQLKPGSGPISVLDNLRAAADEFLRLDRAPPSSPLALLHATASCLHRFAAAVQTCEDAGLDRAELLPHLGPLRALHARSPFVARLQTWPRGYAGDFETVEWLCEARNRAEPGTVSWGIEQYALQSPVAQQHRNKVGLQARAILAAVTANPHARIVSLGCGGCRDLSLVEEYVADSQAKVVLVDADPNALAFARSRLPRVGERCEYVTGTVPRVLARLTDDKHPVDLVVAGGLFDYLPNRWAQATLRAVRGMLAPDGRLLFSNIAAGNPFRGWIEYLADWRLIERDQHGIENLLRDSGFADAEWHIFKDTTGLAFMVDVGIPQAPDRPH